MLGLFMTSFGFYWIITHSLFRYICTFMNMTRHYDPPSERKGSRKVIRKTPRLCVFNLSREGQRSDCRARSAFKADPFLPEPFARAEKEPGAGAERRIQSGSGRISWSEQGRRGVLTEDGQLLITSPGTRLSHNGAAVCLHHF